MSPMTPYGSFDNQGNADVLAMSASDVQSEQVGMKKARHRPSGHAVPFEWQIVALGGARWHCQNIDVPNDYRVSINFSSLCCAAGRWRISC